jgi:hypothetical protein
MAADDRAFQDIPFLAKPYAFDDLQKVLHELKNRLAISSVPEI